MKKTLKLSLLLIMAFGILSFMTRNNFNPDGSDLIGLESEPMVKIEKLYAFVNEKLTQPVFAAIEESNPHAFMMKCYSNVEFHFDHDAFNADHGLETYSNYPVYGRLVYIDCGQEHHMGSVSATFSSQEILVKESYFSEWLAVSDYLVLLKDKIKQTTEE